MGILLHLGLERNLDCAGRMIGEQQRCWAGCCAAASRRAVPELWWLLTKA